MQAEKERQREASETRCGTTETAIENTIESGAESVSKSGAESARKIGRETGREIGREIERGKVTEIGGGSNEIAQLTEEVAMILVLCATIT